LQLNAGRRLQAASGRPQSLELSSQSFSNPVVGWRLWVLEDSVGELVIEIGWNEATGSLVVGTMKRVKTPAIAAQKVQYVL
jgi:hypothetical protein